MKLAEDLLSDLQTSYLYVVVFIHVEFPLRTALIHHRQYAISLKF
jgi:hypothetical protein